MVAHLANERQAIAQKSQILACHSCILLPTTGIAGMACGPAGPPFGHSWLAPEVTAGGPDPIAKRSVDVPPPEPGGLATRTSCLQL
jgi:hypothetical protein